MIPGLFRRQLSVAGSTLLILTTTTFPGYGVEPMESRIPATAPFNVAQLVNESYTLGGGDQIQIDIFDAPEYSGENGRYQVLVDGTLNLPLIGSVSVQGLTLAQVGSLLSEQYLRFYKRPFTTVTLLAPRPLNITLAGEVNSPGSYPIALTQQSPGSTQFPTLTAALQLAGGTTQSADVRKIQIRRLQRGGAAQTITVDLWQFLQGDRQQDLTLRDGDTILIPTATAIDLAEAVQIADSNFAAQPQPINIAVVGEVFRPGSYTVTSNTRTGAAGVPGTTDDANGSPVNDSFPTVTKAIQIAGGIKPLADIRRIQIRRTTRSGAEQNIDVDLLKLIQEGDTRQDTILQAGDTIVIPLATDLTPAEAAEIAAASFSPDTIQVNVVGEVTQPGTVQVPPNTPLNQAILSAGGFDNRRARRSSVDLIRLNPDGTVTKREVPIDFAQEVNDDTNPSLQNNDIIIVRRSGDATFRDGLDNLLGPIGGIVSTFVPVLNLLRIFGN